MALCPTVAILAMSFFTHLNGDLHLGQVGDPHALLAAARIAFARIHAACNRGAHFGIELHDAT